MSSRSRAARAAVLAAVLLVAGSALVAVEYADVDRPADDAGTSAAPGTAAPESPRAARVGRLRSRASTEVPAESSAVAEAAVPGVAPPTVDTLPAPAPTGSSDEATKDATRGILLRDLPLLSATYVLSATPDRDPATGVAPAVAPGRAPEVALAEYVARGSTAVAGAAELVGERKPAVEDGVPVALSGRVVEAEGGAPIAGARVLLSSTFYVRRYFYDQHLREVASAATDADGRWSVERLNVDPAHFGRGGRLTMSVTADAHAPALAVSIADASPGVANRVQDVALRRAAETLRGQVLDLWEGRPVVGARVYATGAISPVTYPKDERAALFVGAPWAVTDADGRFTIEGLGSGLQTISVHGTDDCIGWTTVTLPHAAELAVRTRQLRGRIEGTTVDPQGAPVALVTVTCDDNSTHSFADGHFALENFRGDAVTIRFLHPDWAPVVLEGVRDGTTALVVRLERPRIEVVLEVRDRDTGAPVPRVQLLFTFAAGSAPPPPTSPERLAADGRYRLRLPAGATHVAVAAADRATESVPVAGLADGDRVAVTLAPSAAK
jgi:protocatechuate 3,4-dioxygenase beta subunit